MTNAIFVRASIMIRPQPSSFDERTKGKFYELSLIPIKNKQTSCAVALYMQRKWEKEKKTQTIYLNIKFKL